ncbi:MAG: hypothetical protein IPJ62_14610 [Betaproteobacteria bacterium]|nr:hypothetical protein [Betaproteobacteria bacterium]
MRSFAAPASSSQASCSTACADDVRVHERDLVGAASIPSGTQRAGDARARLAISSRSRGFSAGSRSAALTSASITRTRCRRRR